MNVRQRNYPPQFWLRLHKHLINPIPPLIKRQHSSRIKLNTCLSTLSPHIQKFIYSRAIDKRKGEIRFSRFPLSPEQFNVLNHLGLTYKYEPLVSFEQEPNLEYSFIHKN
jgi:hypothetical protein